MRTLNSKFIGRTYKGKVSEPGDFRRGGFSEAGRAVDPGPDRRTAERESVDTRQRLLDPLQVVRQHRGITRPFLAKSEWRRILHVGAADLDDVVPFSRLGRDRIA
jgi:hypothetical protein